MKNKITSFNIPSVYFDGWESAKSLEELPRLPGLYAIFSNYKLEECLYVGKSQSSIRGRLSMSTHKPNLLAQLNFKSPCYLYKVIQTSDIREICFQECFAISVFRPIWNFGKVDWSDEKLVMEEKLRRFRESFKDKPEEWRKIEEELARRNISLETYLYPSLEK